MPAYHPGSDLLIDYVSGAAPEPVALLVATHVSLCRDCRDEVARLEVLGGALLETLDGEPLGAEALDRALARLDLPESLVAAPLRTAPAKAGPRVPHPLSDYLAGDLDALPWKTRGGVAEVDLLAGYPGFRTRLLRIRAGAAVPRHTHEGREFTLLLAGGFSDHLGHYRRGDVAEADAGIDHRPLADADEDCLCLAVTDAPLRLTGPFGRYLNRFLRI